MGQTIIEKILTAHNVEKKKLYADDIAQIKLDLVLANDVTAPLAIKEFEKIGIKKVFNKNKIALVMDHFTPAKDIKSAEQVKFVREFANKHKIKNYYEGGEVGIEHALLPEKGLVLPGFAVIGADSHTCTYGALGAFSTGVGSTDVAAAMATGETWVKVPQTIKFIIDGKLNKWVSGKDIILYIIGMIGVDGANYKAMEISGSAIKALSMDDRFTICNMGIEAGAKCAVIEPDSKTLNYVKKRAKQKYKIFQSDKDAEYVKVIKIKASDIPVTVACPHLPENTVDVKKLKNTKIGQVVIGSCTNGRISDLKIAAQILKGKKVKKGLRLYIFPATPAIYKEAMQKGYIKIFLEAGAVVNPPSCGPCLGGHLGILAAGEVALASTNRNFVGRMGSPESFVYLANPAVCAASAIKGKIATCDIYENKKH